MTDDSICSVLQIWVEGSLGGSLSWWGPPTCLVQRLLHRPTDLCSSVSKYMIICNCKPYLKISKKSNYSAVSSKGTTTVWMNFVIDTVSTLKLIMYFMRTVWDGTSCLGCGTVITQYHHLMIHIYHSVIGPYRSATGPYHSWWSVRTTLSDWS